MHLTTVCFVLLAASSFAQDIPEKPQSSVGNDRPQVQPHLPSLITPLAHRTLTQPYHPIIPRQRVRWFISNTIGPSHLFGAGGFSAALGTALYHPKEYGPHWGGFADRFGMRLTGISTGNAMEATVGSLWGEDPRYFGAPDEPLKGRLMSVIKQTFTARRRDGEYAPAYARYTAVTGSNFLSNTWRVHSEANVHEAFIRTAEGFAGRMAANAWEEFWPNVRNRFFRSH
jgi:hypothetical protein